MEGVSRPDIGLTLVASHWGLKKPQPSHVESSTGFKVLYQSDIAHTPLSARRDQAVQVAADTIHRSISGQGWQTTDVSQVFVGSSNIWDELFIPDIIEAANLSRIDPHQVHVTALACNSGVRALQEGLKHGKHEPSILLTVDDLTGQVTSEQEADELSWNIFSNGVAALALIPGQSLSHVVGTDLVVFPDTQGALAIRTNYPPDENNAVGTLTQTPNWEYVTMPRPRDPSHRIEMQGPATAKLFVGLVARHAPQFLSALDLDQIPHWISHQPSLGPFELIRRRFPALNLNWAYPEGNSSGSTALVAMVKQLEDFEPSRQIGILGFGAGATFTLEIAKLGQS
jgi:hypothetical protein